MRHAHHPFVIALLSGPLALGALGCGHDGPTGPTTGSLALAVTGLPNGTAAGIAVNGPNGFAATVDASQTLTALKPGDYSIVAANIAAAGGTWAATPAVQTVPVKAGTTPAAGPVSFAIITGSLTVTIAGLPDGLSGSVAVAGPGGFNRQLTATEAISGLVPGTYTLTAGEVVGAAAAYGPDTLVRTATVAASTSPSTALVTYADNSGSLTVTVTGLSAGTSAAVTVQGPLGVSRFVTATQVLGGLPPGTYTVSPARVTDAGGTWAPSNPAPPGVVLAAGGAAGAAVQYVSVPPGTLNLAIDGLYITQSVQRYNGSVPLARGRPGLLRVFVKGSEPNGVAPAVRVRLFQNGVPKAVLTLAAPAGGGGAPTVIDEGSIFGSWNVVIPDTLMQIGLSLLADVDPGSVVAEPDETDNQYPASGTPQALDVRAAPAFSVRLVPVMQTANSLQGLVNDGNRDQFLSVAMKIHPLPGYSADVRLPYTTSAPALDANNTNGAWGTILSELSSLRLADGSSRSYYGVVKTTYSSGVAGIGYVGAPIAMGWDYQPSGASVAAHEWGHNWGRYHAPCGNPGNPDQSYPYPGGVTGAWGYDLNTGALKPPSMTDVMGYCGNQWISDYTYSGVLNFRSTQASASAARAAARIQPVLLVWGRMSDSGVVLEPAFRIDAPPSMPRTAGADLLEGIDAGGGVLFSLPFTADAVADSPLHERTFAFAIPESMAATGSLATLRLTSAPLPGGAARVALATAAVAPPDAGVEARPAGTGLARITWNAAAYPMVLVRDAATGAVLSFARGGDATIRVPGPELALTLSDRVRSVGRRVRVPAQ